LDQLQKIRKINGSKKFSPYIFSGVECDILKDGKLDFPNDLLKELDFVIISIHRSFQLDEKTMTSRMIRAIENPTSTIVGHLTGRLLLEREPYRINTSKIIDACIANGKIIELNGHPMLLDMDWRLWHKARDKGLKTLINPDAHSTEDLVFVQTGVKVARKGWLRKRDVLNTLPLTQMQSYLKKCKSGR
jgi:DNA polymerase (family 10)